MSDYLAAHKGIVAIATDASSITETTDGTPGTLPAIPGSPTLIGYTPTLPELSKKLGNGKGFAVGVAGAAYNRYGSPRPTVTVDLLPGSAGTVLTAATRVSDVLPYLAVYVGVGGVFTEVVRKCKLSEVVITLAEPSGEGGGGEIHARMTFMGLCTQTLGSPIATSESSIKALGKPLMWHDVRGLTIPVPDGEGEMVGTPFRNALMGLTATLNHNLEYKGVRPDDTDGTNPLSRCAYEIIEHHINASAELSFHKRLTRALFTGAVNAQEWGDVLVGIANADESNSLNMTLKNAFVTDETIRGVQSSEQLSYTVPVELDDLLFS